MNTFGDQTDFSTTLDAVAKSEPRKCKRRRKKKVGSVSHIKYLETAHDDNQLDVYEVSVVPVSKYKRIVFDDEGNVKSTVALEKFHQQTASHRKSSKRSGCFYFKSDQNPNLIDPIDDPSKSFFSEGYTEQQSGNLLQDFTVTVPVDRHMEVYVHRLPNDYETVVQYWYLNLDQLNRLESVYPNMEENNKQLLSVSEETSQWDNASPLSDSPSADATLHISLASFDKGDVQKHAVSISEESPRADNASSPVDILSADVTLHSSLAPCEKCAVQESVSQ